MKKLRVTVEGKVYEVLVEVLGDSIPGASPAPAVAAPVAAPAAAAPAPAAAPAAPAPTPAPAAPASAGANDVPSPLAGKVVSVDVTVGQAVAEGAQLLTIEAMKMNTYIFAPRAGKVEAILVNAGDPVDEGAPLVRLS